MTLAAVRSFADDTWDVLFNCPCPWGRVSLARGFPRVQSAPVPELPDLDVVADALHAALAGRTVTGARALMPLAVRGTPAELAALEGQRLERVVRAGKFLDLELARDRVVVNPMLTGRFQLAGRGEKAPGGVAVELSFGPRTGGPPGDAATWTSGAPWLPEDAAQFALRLPFSIQLEYEGSGFDYSRDLSVLAFSRPNRQEDIYMLSH